MRFQQLFESALQIYRVLLEIKDEWYIVRD